MEIKACIFDLDGVIVDTAKYHFIAWRELAHELGFNFTEKDNERLKGVSRMRSLDILLEVGGKSFDEQTKLKLAAKKNDIYVSYIKKMTPSEILPGVRDFIEDLRANRIRTALGSASKNAVTVIERLNISSFFDAIIDGNKVQHAKPNPEIFLLGAKELCIPPENCVVFEDAEVGIEAALAGGMGAIGVGKPEILGKANGVIPGFAHFSFQKLKAIFN